MESPPKTNLFQKILEEVAKIPEGKVTTYGTIAKNLQIKDARKVGWALHTNKDPKKYPCHRVVKKDGSLPSGYVFGGPEVQKNILESEGIKFIDDKVDPTYILI